MLGFENNGFIISIALSLLIGAVVFYYFNSKIRSVENALTKQNNILTSFIGDVQNDLKTNITQHYIPSGPVSNDATEEAKTTAAQVFENNKITVSDDSESENDSDDEYSDDDTDNENMENMENMENIGKVIDLETNDNENNLDTVVDIEETPADAKQEIKSISLSQAIHNIGDDIGTNDSLTVSEEESELDSDIDIDEAKTPLLEDAVLPIQQDKPITDDITPILEHSKQIVNDNTNAIETSGLDVHKLFTKHQASSNNVLENESTQYSKMKVDELRKLVVDRNIVQQDAEVSKMKKKDIVALIESNDMKQ